jgi:DNA invertase Pin-like site-specific DNA recombinase
VSTKDQKLDMQLDALKQYGVEKIFTEKLSGTKADRPEFQGMLNYLREGDTLVVWRLDRLGRSLRDLLNTVEDLKERSINLVSLQENIDTSTTTGKTMLGFFGLLAEMERNFISDRVRTGLEAARARGHIGGRPPVTEDKIKLVLKLYESKEYSIPQIQKMVGISKATLYRYLNLSKKQA